MKKRAQKRNAEQSLPDSCNENKELSWKTKRTVRLNVNFQKIEDNPVTDLHFEILSKIAKSPSPHEPLVREEEIALLQKTLQRLYSLTRLERYCINLTFRGYRICEIARRLSIGEHAAQSYLSRAVCKVKTSIEEGDETKNKF